MATVSDDTMINLWYIQSDEEPNDVQLMMSQRISDMLLVGVSFGETENSLIVAPYDFKFLIHFKNLV